MAVLFDGEIDVHYGFFFLQPPDADPDLSAATGGQVNGLCGAAQLGALSFVTGLHTGPLPLRVEWVREQPALAPTWEDVVEVSLLTDTPQLSLQAFEECVGVQLPAPGSYRVRYCATGMDAAVEADTRDSDEPVLDRYLVQLWPAPPGPDAVVRQTSRIAGYWHGVARHTPAPLTAEEVARAERALIEHGEAKDEHDAWKWAHRPPSDRLLALGGRASRLAHADRPLLDAVAACDAQTQRAIAAWAARRACEIAGAATLDWVARALTVLAQGGTDLPAPFDDEFAALAQLRSIPRDVQPAAGLPEPDSLGVTLTVTPEEGAVGAICCADSPDPPWAAVTALEVASEARPDRSAFFAEVRRAFPALTAT